MECSAPESGRRRRLDLDAAVRGAATATGPAKIQAQTSAVHAAAAGAPPHSGRVRNIDSVLGQAATAREG